MLEHTVPVLFLHRVCTFARVALRPNPCFLCFILSCVLTAVVHACAVFLFAHVFCSLLLSLLYDIFLFVVVKLKVDKLVQLLESPIFLHLRLQLLDVDSPSYPALLKSLYGILMLLPQVPNPPFLLFLGDGKNFVGAATLCVCVSEKI